MSLTVAFEVSMAITSVCAVLLAGWLWWQGQKQAAMPALAGFAAMMALWCSGHIAIVHQQPALGVALVLANPLMPMFFLHFSLQFVATRPRRWLLPLLYSLTLLLIGLSWLGEGGAVQQTAGFDAFFVFSGIGWLNLLYTVLLGIAAHAVLWQGWRQLALPQLMSLADFRMSRPDLFQLPGGPGAPDFAAFIRKIDKFDRSWRD